MVGRTRQPRYRPLAEDDLPPEQLRELLRNPEARDTRRAADLGKLAIFPGMKLHGRRRVSERDSVSFDFHLPSEIPEEKVLELGRTLRGKQPVLAKFNRKAGIDEPTPEVLNRYVHGPKIKNKRQPVDPTDKHEQRIINQVRRRQPERIRDDFQRTTYEKFVQAKVCRASLDLVRKQGKAGQELDQIASIWAAQAIFDFGASLDEGKEGKEVLREVHDEGLGGSIKYVGELAFEDPSVLTQNPQLLRLVQIEQAEQETFWQQRYDLSTRVFMRDRLTDAHHEIGREIYQEVTRMRELATEILPHA